MRKKSRRMRNHTGEARKKLVVKHARKRLGERYGLWVSEKEYWQLAESIASRNGSARFLYRQRNLRTWHLLTVKEEKVIAVFDWAGRRITTFLGMEALSDIGLKAEDVA